jgi:hypothetical protein
MLKRALPGGCRLKLKVIAEPGGSLDAGKHGGAGAAISLAAQVTLIVIAK